MARPPGPEPERLGGDCKVRAGVLCFRVAGEGEQPEGLVEAPPPRGELELLLVSRRSRSQGRLMSMGEESPADPTGDMYTIPAGKFEAGLDVSYEECALREAMEEAGVECERVADLGWYPSRSKRNEPIQTRYFLARCVRELDGWDEDGERVRSWFSAATALQLAGYREDLSAAVGHGVEVAHRLCLPCPQQRSSFRRELPGSTDLRAEEGLIGRMPSQGSVTSLSDAAERQAETYTFYSNQVGGHFCLVKPADGTLLDVEPPWGSSGMSGAGDNIAVQGSKVLLKPLDESEFRFYCHLPERPTSALLPFTPRFFGTKTLRREQIGQLARQGLDTASATCKAGVWEEKASFWEARRSSQGFRRYIVLEDLGSRASKPCFMDLKMGCRQRSARHGAAKRASMAAKALKTTSGKLGFRICGMQCYEDGVLRFYDKYWGQRITVEAMSGALSRFLPQEPGGEAGPPTGARKDVILRILDQLRELRRAVEQQPGLRLWSCSLLLCFDAAALAEGRHAELLRSLLLRTIDFAHVVDTGDRRPDEEYLCGLDNFRVHLEALLRGPPEEAAAWLAGRLAPVPPAGLHDAEEERATQAAQGDQPGAPPPPAEEDRNREANYSTTSGVTGNPLMCELASHGIMWPTGVAGGEEALAGH